MQNRISVFIIAEQPIVRWGLKAFLEDTFRVDVLGESETAEQADEQIKSLQPNIIAIDFGGSNGRDYKNVKRLALEHQQKILCLSTDESWSSVDAFLKAGGLGYVAKRAPLNELSSALLAVARGQQWVSPCLRAVNGSNGLDGSILSPREREIVMLIARGLTSTQIASQLCVSLKTVETHRYRIFKKLQISARSQLVSYALDNNIL